MQNLKLTRPLAVFDLETTGIDVEKDRIVQLAIIRVEPYGTRRTFETLVNPERPIPPEATAVHGIKDADVRDAPTFAQVRREVEELLADADLAGFNSVNFDQPLLMAEMKRAGSELEFRGRRHLDAMRIFHRMERRDLTAAYRFLAATPSVLVGVRLADLVGPEAQTNVPGTVDEHPNWRRRSAMTVEAIAAAPAFAAVTAAMRDKRPRPQALD